jgi:hypothetical protein
MDLHAMDAKDHVERDSPENSICRLEWIAWAMDAARRYKEAEQFGIAPSVERKLPDEG